MQAYTIGSVHGKRFMRMAVALFLLTFCLPSKAAISNFNYNDSISNIPALDKTATDSASCCHSGSFSQNSINPLNRPETIYSQPLSWTDSDPWWHGMWINTAVLSGAFVSTLFVLELLPEDATSWNRAEIQDVPFYKRWYRNIFKKGPEWDHDNVIFNYVLHPYAGAVYFMSARTCGFNFWQSMLYSAAISTIGWEFGIEACMERPSYQDLFITPIVGSFIGEGFYRMKRNIVQNDYMLLGSPILGHVAAFIFDPVNEFVGLFAPKQCRSLGPGCMASYPICIQSSTGSFVGYSFTASF